MSRPWLRTRRSSLHSSLPKGALPLWRPACGGTVTPTTRGKCFPRTPWCSRHWGEM